MNDTAVFLTWQDEIASNPVLFKQLSEIFVTENTDTAKRLKTLMQAGDFKTITPIAHTLKSSAALIVQSDLNQAAAAAEFGTKDNNNTIEQKELLVENLIAELEKSLQSIGEL